MPRPRAGRRRSRGMRHEHGEPGAPRWRGTYPPIVLRVCGRGASPYRAAAFFVVRGAPPPREDRASGPVAALNVGVITDMGLHFFDVRGAPHPRGLAWGTHPPRE